MNLYLAGPIDSATKQESTWKQVLQEVLQHQLPEDPLDGQWTAFDPAAPWLLFGTVDHRPHRSALIEIVNRSAIQHCDVLVAYQPSHVMSVGTSMEIFEADEMGKDIIIFSDIPFSRSAYLQNRVERRHYFCMRDYSNDMPSVMSAVGRALHSIARDIRQHGRGKRFTNHEAALKSRAEDNAPRHEYQRKAE